MIIAIPTVLGQLADENVPAQAIPLILSLLLSKGTSLQQSVNLLELITTGLSLMKALDSLKTTRPRVRLIQGNNSSTLPS